MAIVTSPNTREQYYFYQVGTGLVRKEEDGTYSVTFLDLGQPGLRIISEKHRGLNGARTKLERIAQKKILASPWKNHFGHFHPGWSRIYSEERWRESREPWLPGTEDSP